MLSLTMVIISMATFVLLGVDLLSQPCSSCPCDTTKQHMSVPNKFTTRVLRPRTDGQPADIVENRYVPTYFFEFQSDSCDLNLAFAEFTLNRRLIALHAHCMDQHWNWNSTSQQYVGSFSEVQLGQISRTRWFDASSSDTIGFHRRWLLKSHIGGDILTSYWHCPSSLSYCVELIDSASNSRLMLLDSFTIASTTPSRKPSFYSMYPLDSRVRQVLPSFIGNQRKVAMRVNVFSTPSQSEHWTRSDIRTYAPSLVGAKWYGGTWKRVSLNNASGQNGSCAPFAVPISGGCTVSPFNIQGASTVAFTMVNGMEVASISLPTTQVYQPLGSGSYIVAVKSSSGMVLCTNLIYVN